MAHRHFVAQIADRRADVAASRPDVATNRSAEITSDEAIRRHSTSHLGIDPLTDAAPPSVARLVSNLRVS
jgi:hypothetical protein